MQGALSLVLTGDSMITRGVGAGESDAARQLAVMIGEADVAFTNLEVLPNDFRGYPAQESGGTHIAANSWVVDELSSLGFNLLSAATNHALDYSIEGLLATIDVLDQYGISYAGIGRNLSEARMPVYLDTDTGSVALISCCSTFGKGQQAGEQRPDMQGRPGLNPLRYTTTYEITDEQMAALQSIAVGLGVEQQRQERIRLGFAFPPDDPANYQFFDTTFRVAEQQATRTSANRKDLDAIAQWVREARARADYVVVSLHAHEQRETKEEPAEFIPVFAHRMIDEGADLVVGHGPHLLRGMEMYQGKPIFYSLGNFIAQNDLVHKLPADAYERFRVDPSLTPSEISRQRSDDGRRGFPSDVRYWETIMPRLLFQSGRLHSLEFVPVTLNQREPSHRRGRPRLAEGDEATSILDRFAKLSQPFGTEIEHDGRRGIVRVTN